MRQPRSTTSATRAARNGPRSKPQHPARPKPLQQFQHRQAEDRRVIAVDRLEQMRAQFLELISADARKHGLAPPLRRRALSVRRSARASSERQRRRRRVGIRRRAPPRKPIPADVRGPTIAGAFPRDPPRRSTCAGSRHRATRSDPRRRNTRLGAQNSPPAPWLERARGATSRFGRPLARCAASI